MIIRCCDDNQDHAVAVGHSVDPARWRAAFDALLGRVAGRFGRVEVRRRARAFVLGLLADLVGARKCIVGAELRVRRRGHRATMIGV